MANIEIVREAVNPMIWRGSLLARAINQLLGQVL